MALRATYTTGSQPQRSYYPQQPQSPYLAPQGPQAATQLPPQQQAAFSALGGRDTRAPQTARPAVDPRHQAGQTMAAPTSPVAANGQIPPPQPPAVTMPAPAGDPGQQTINGQAAPTPGVDVGLLPVPGWVQLPGGGWVPPTDPRAKQAQQAPAAGAPSGQAVPNPAQFPGTGQFSPYYTATPYTPTPGLEQTTQGQLGLANQMLASPESLSPQVIAQLQQRQKEQALAQQQAAIEAFQQQAASRGTSGINDATTRRIGDATQQNILGSNRDIAIAAASQNAQDRLNTLGAVGGALGQINAFDLGRNQFTQAGQQAAAESAYNQQRLLLDSLLGNRGLDIQQLLGQGGLDVDWGRIRESGRQFDLGNQLNWGQLLNNMLIQRYGLGLDLAQLQQLGTNNTNQLLFGH